MRVKVRGKAIPASFLKIEERGDARWGDRPEREGQIEELVNGQNSCAEAPPMSKKRQETMEQRRCQEKSDCQRSDGEGWVCQGH